jgi:hypothetical protein
VPVSDDQVRLDILELLYKHRGDNATRSGVDRAIIQATLKLSEKQMDINISYLEDKALVTLSRTLGSQWTFAKITSDGIEVIENKERYADKFSFTQASTSQIQDEDHENIREAVSSETIFPLQVTDTFRQARDQVRATKLSRSDEEKIEKQLKALEKELQKNKKADLGTIQKDWVELKKKASWLSPILSRVVLEGIKKSLDIE